MGDARYCHSPGRHGEGPDARASLGRQYEESEREHAGIKRGVTGKKIEAKDNFFSRD